MKRFQNAPFRVQTWAPAIASASALVLLLSFAFGSLGALPSSATGAASVSAVGSLAYKVGNNTTSLAVSPQYVGDLLVLVVKADAAGVTASSIAGGGVNTWRSEERRVGKEGRSRWW